MWIDRTFSQMSISQHSQTFHSNLINKKFQTDKRISNSACNLLVDCRFKYNILLTTFCLHANAKFRKLNFSYHACFLFFLSRLLELFLQIQSSEFLSIQSRAINLSPYFRTEFWSFSLSNITKSSETNMKSSCHGDNKSSFETQIRHSKLKIKLILIKVRIVKNLKEMQQIWNKCEANWSYKTTPTANTKLIWLWKNFEQKQNPIVDLLRELCVIFSIEQARAETPRSHFLL